MVPELHIMNEVSQEYFEPLLALLDEGIIGPSRGN